MAARLSAVLGGPVSIKATRAEGLGALGRAEGIAAQAAVMVLVVALMVPVLIQVTGVLP